MPGRVVDVEPRIGDLAAIAIVDLSAGQVGQSYRLVAELGKRQRQAALPLVAGVIDNDDMAAFVLSGPGVGDKAIRGPVVGPGRLRLDLRPSAVAKGAGVLQNL